MRKDLTVFVATNEEGEEVKINRLTTEPGFFLLTLGQNRMVIDGGELIEAIQAIEHYSILFDEEQRRREQRAASPPKAIVVTPAKVRGRGKVNKEDEDALVLEAQIRTGPTASELALEKQTKHMQGETIVLVEKKE